MAGDDQDLLELLAFWLTRRGHHVLSLPGRPEKVADTAGARFDVAVLDCLRPIDSCASMARLIRADPDQAGAPVVLLTASATGREVDQAVTDGVTAHLHKPFRLGELAAVIDRFLAAGADLAQERHEAGSVDRKPASDLQ